MVLSDQSLESSPMRFRRMRRPADVPPVRHEESFDVETLGPLSGLMEGCFERVPLLVEHDLPLADDVLIAGENRGLFDDVLELPDVTWPIVSAQLSSRPGRE